MEKVRNCLFVLLIATSSMVRAQSKLMVQGSSPQLFLIHTVVPKENWYSIGRIYNQSPKEIAPFNKTTLEKPLAIGQKVKIPLNNINFSQDGKRAADEVFVPLYHTVQEKEWMYRISTTHNNVAIENLEKWNHVKNDQLKSGMQLVVGYLKVKQSLSPLAASGSTKIQTATTAPPVVLNENKQPEGAKKEIPVAIVKEEPKKPEAKVVAAGEVVKEEVKPVNTQPVNNNGPVDHKGGTFRKLYEETGNSTTGNAGIFRSTSGWNDGKYYALMNNVPVGTIVKVSFSSTNKTVYAKVLGQLPDMKESQGLTLRISEAAASELGVSLNKFYVDIKY